MKWLHHLSYVTGATAIAMSNPQILLTNLSRPRRAFDIHIRNLLPQLELRETPRKDSNRFPFPIDLQLMVK